MAHRGRLNVVNTLGKNPSDLFAEFEGKHVDDLPAGDVKYHQGFSSDVSTTGRSGAFEPRVQPVAFGNRQPGGGRLARVKIAAAMKQVSKFCRCRCMAMTAFAGQGGDETQNLAQTRGYGSTRGTLPYCD